MSVKVGVKLFLPTPWRQTDEWGGGMAAIILDLSTRDEWAWSTRRHCSQQSLNGGRAALRASLDATEKKKYPLLLSRIEAWSLGRPPHNLVTIRTVIFSYIILVSAHSKYMFSDMTAELKERSSPSKNQITSQIIFDWDEANSKTVALIYPEYMSYQAS